MLPPTLICSMPVVADLYGSVLLFWFVRLCGNLSPTVNKRQTQNSKIQTTS